MDVVDLGITVRSIARVLGDSNRTRDIHFVEEVTGRERLGRFAEELRRSAEGRELLRVQPELSAAWVDYYALRALPEGTLGRAYTRHLDDNGITAELQALPVTYVADRDVAYLVRRFRQTHDLWHVLTGLGVTPHEEVVIHAFSWGQLRLPVSTLVVVFGSLKHLVLESRWGALRHSLREAYEAGRDAAPLLGVAWEKRWAEPLDEVRALVRVRPLSRRHLDA
jgi:ubiquinone biosynthesis protein COQ4